MLQQKCDPEKFTQDYNFSMNNGMHLAQYTDAQIGFSDVDIHEPSGGRNDVHEANSGAHITQRSYPASVFSNSTRVPSLKSSIVGHQKGPVYTKFEPTPTCQCFSNFNKSPVLEWNSPSDPRNPKNWSKSKKWFVTFTTGYLSLIVSLGCSLYAADSLKLILFFGCTEQQVLAGITVYLVGLSLAPIIGAPLSEKIGRKWIYVGMVPTSMAFIAGTIAARNIETLLVCRFFTGLFGSPVLVIAAGTIADLWDLDMLLLAMTMFSLTPLLGPILGPIVGGYVVQNFHLTWRFTFYIQLILSFIAIPLVLLMPETYKPVILKNTHTKDLQSQRTDQQKCNYCMSQKHFDLPTDSSVTLSMGTSICSDSMLELPQFTKSSDNTLSDRCKLSMKNKNSMKLVKEFFVKTVFFPIKLLFEEPIILIASIYASFVFAILFSFLESYPVIFTDGYHFKPGETGLAFWGIGVGIILSAIFFILVDRLYVQKVLKELQKSTPTPLTQDSVSSDISFENPERTLVICKVGSILLPISLFWQGWSAHFHFHWMIPLAAGVPFGISLMFIFFGLIIYFEFVYDNDPTLLASVFAANNLLRYSFAAGFPLFITKMYSKLGINWSATIFGCIALALVPVPWIFEKIGPSVRKNSKYAHRPREYTAKSDTTPNDLSFQMSAVNLNQGAQEYHMQGNTRKT